MLYQKTLETDEAKTEHWLNSALLLGDLELVLAEIKSIRNVSINVDELFNVFIKYTKHEIFAILTGFIFCTCSLRNLF